MKVVPAPRERKAHSSFFNKRNQSFLEKCLIQGLEWGKFKMNVGHLMMPKSKDMPPKGKMEAGLSKGHWKQLEVFPKV